MRAVDTDVPLLEKMRAAGCYRVFTGFETLNRNALHLTQKGTNPDVYVRHIQNLEKVGIELHAAFIIGCPGDTEETVLETLAAIKQIAPRMVTFNNIKVYPGTPLFDAPEEFGLVIPDPFWFEKKDWIEAIPVGTKQLPPAKIRELQMRCRLEYYNGGQA